MHIEFVYVVSMISRFLDPAIMQDDTHAVNISDLAYVSPDSDNVPDGLFT